MALVWSRHLAHYHPASDPVFHFSVVFCSAIVRGSDVLVTQTIRGLAITGNDNCREFDNDSPRDPGHDAVRSVSGRLRQPVIRAPAPSPDFVITIYFVITVVGASDGGAGVGTTGAAGTIGFDETSVLASNIKLWLLGSNIV